MQREHEKLSTERLSELKTFWYFLCAIYLMSVLAGCTGEGQTRSRDNLDVYEPASPVIEIFDQEHLPDNTWTIQTLRECHDGMGSDVKVYGLRLFPEASVEVGGVKYVVFSQDINFQRNNFDARPYVGPLVEAVASLTADMLAVGATPPEESVLMSADGQQDRAIPIILNLANWNDSYVADTCQELEPELVSGLFKGKGAPYTWLDVVPGESLDHWLEVANHEIFHDWQPWPTPDATVILPIDIEGGATFVELRKDGVVSEETVKMRSGYVLNELSSYYLSEKRNYLPEIGYDNNYMAVLWWLGAESLVETVGKPAELPGNLELAPFETVIWLEQALNQEFYDNIQAADAGVAELAIGRQQVAEFYERQFGEQLGQSGKEVVETIGLYGIAQVLLNPDLMALSQPYRESNNFLSFSAVSLPATLSVEDVGGCYYDKEGYGVTVSIVENCNYPLFSPLTIVNISGPVTELEMVVTEAGVKGQYEAIILVVDDNGGVMGQYMFSSSSEEREFRAQLPEGGQVLILQQIDRENARQQEATDSIVSIKGW